MAICEYERRVLARIASDDRPDDPGAAWWAACEALAGRGMIKRGVLTDAGWAALAPAFVGKTFKHPSNKAPGWRPLCHVRGVVDGQVVFRWYGRRKQWWHYEVLPFADLGLCGIDLSAPAG